MERQFERVSAVQGGVQGSSQSSANPSHNSDSESDQNSVINPHTCLLVLHLFLAFPNLERICAQNRAAKAGL